MSTLSVKDGDGANASLLARGATVQSIVGGDFVLEAYLGNVEGFSAVNKFGRAENLDTGSSYPIDVWDGVNAYSGFPTGAAETMEIVSDSGDDSTSGTGARTVSIGNLLDDSGNLMPDVEVTLNGTTPVSLGAQTYTRSTRIKTLTVGSGGANAGTLTLRHSTTTANIFGLVLPGKLGTRALCYTVPTGKTLVVLRGNIMLSRSSGSAGSANVTIRTRGTTTDAPFLPIRDLEVTDSNGYTFAGPGYFVFSAGTDLKVTVEGVSDNDTIISSEFDAFIIDD